MRGGTDKITYEGCRYPPETISYPEMVRIYAEMFRKNPLSVIPNYQVVLAAAYTPLKRPEEIAAVVINSWRITLISTCRNGSISIV